LGECERIMDDRECRIGQMKTTVCVEKFKISFDFFVINTGISISEGNFGPGGK